MKWSTKLTKLIGVDYPIIQAPMFGVTTAEMVAAAANINCLGSLALGDLSSDKCIEAIRATKKLTHKPFAVNIFTHTVPPLTKKLEEDYNQARSFIQQLAKDHHLTVELPYLEDLHICSYTEQIEALLAENCKIVSFTFGNLDNQSITKFKNNDTLLIGTCTCVAEAKILENAGVDIICVQGIEAGGHRGSFTSENIPMIGGLSLLSQVRDTIHHPIIYAGGICNSKTLLATHCLGADGFQVGSLLLCATESALLDFEKKRLQEVKEDEIVLTKSFSGRYARGIKNKFITSMEQEGLILPYPYQNKLTNELRKIAKINKNVDFVNIWLGQSISKYSNHSTADILQKLIKEVQTK